MGNHVKKVPLVLEGNIPKWTRLEKFWPLGGFEMDWMQIIGYSGSFLVALSLTMNNLFRLRKINLFGAFTFACYGFLIKAYPVLLLNGFITLTDVFYLWRMYRKKEYFDLLKIQDAQSPYLRRFLKFYEKNILLFFPEFTLPSSDDLLIVFVMRNLKPAGLFIGRVQGGECHVLMDYVTPEYRDLKGGLFMLEQRKPFFQEQGVTKVVSRPFCTQHEHYLLKIGFQYEDKREGRFLIKQM